VRSREVRSGAVIEGNDWSRSQTRSKRVCLRGVPFEAEGRGRVCSTGNDCINAKRMAGKIEFHFFGLGDFRRLEVVRGTRDESAGAYLGGEPANCDAIHSC
jgi:hypothetical protein